MATALHAASSWLTHLFAVCLIIISFFLNSFVTSQFDRIKKQAVCYLIETMNRS